jgi:hypothetical protein
MTARPHRFALSLFAAVIVTWLVAMFALMRASALPPETQGKMLVVFDPGIATDQAFASITRAGANPIRQTSLGFIWVVEGQAGELEQQGALGTYKELPISPLIAGCVAAVDAKFADALNL